MTSNNWSTYKLGDLVESISVKHKFDKPKLIFLNTSDILNGEILHHNYSDITTFPGQAKKSIQKGDILFSEIRPKNRRFALVDFDSNDYVVSTKLMVLRKKSELIDNNYLYLYLTSQQTLYYLQTIAEGRSGTFPQITFKEVSNIDIQLPSIEEQGVIAKILTTLDEKIETNNQINEKLEEMAQALFKHWFVDFEFPNENGEPYKSSGGEMVESELGLIPIGWKVKSIKDLDVVTSDYVANGSFKTLKENVSMVEDNGYAVFMRNTDLKSNFSSGMKFVDKHSYEFLAKTKLFGNEVIISNVGDVGSVYLCPDLGMPMTLGNNVILLKSENDINENYFFYRLFKSDLGQHLLSTITSGSVQLKFNKTDFRNLKIIYPKENILKKYLEVDMTLESKIQLNNKESSRLFQLRDSLIPKLMSGEIRVPLEEEILSTEH